MKTLSILLAATVAAMALVAATPAHGIRVRHCHYDPLLDGYEFPTFDAARVHGMRCLMADTIPEGMARWWSHHHHFPRKVRVLTRSLQPFDIAVCRYQLRQGDPNSYLFASCRLRHHPRRWLTVAMGS